MHLLIVLMSSQQFFFLFTVKIGKSVNDNLQITNIVPVSILNAMFDHNQKPFELSTADKIHYLLVLLLH